MPRGKRIVKAVARVNRAAAKPRRDAAWKVAEREVARYFGTERVGIGQEGHDTREVPAVDAWLRLRCPQMRMEEFQSATDEPTHVFVESKCHKQLLPTLERWHAVVQSNPDKKAFIPMMVIGELEGSPSDLLGFCRLEDFPRVYRGFLAPPGRVSHKIWFANLLSRFFIVRQNFKVHGTIKDALKQSDENAAAWKDKQVPTVVWPLSVVYVKYPKRITPALVFRIPS
jgi:hypothetical protein